MTATINKRQIMAVWTQHVINVRKLQNTVLLLMQHPDATPDQLAHAHLAMVEIMKVHRASVEKVRAIWPSYLPFPNIEERII